jgi:hypothetical protein
VQTDDEEDHESHGAEQNMKAVRSLQTALVMVRPLFSSDQLAYWHLFQPSFVLLMNATKTHPVEKNNRHDDEQSQQQSLVTAVVVVVAASVV